MMARIRKIRADVSAFLNSDHLAFSALMAILCLAVGFAIVLCSLDLMAARSLCLHGVVRFC